MHNYKKLNCWIKSVDLVEKIYKITDTFPKKEMFCLSQQMNRCAISIPSNIAEGSGRGEKEFIHFLNISLGSSFELETQIEISFRLKYISETEKTEIDKEISDIQKITFGYQNKLRQELAQK